MSGFWMDKTVLISGASSGIGEAVARHIWTAGARVGLIARRRTLLEQIADSLGERVGVAVADVGDERQLQDGVDCLNEQLGTCDVAIACAGIYLKTPGLQFDSGRVNRVVDTNLKGVVNLIGAVLPPMLDRQGGNIAAISSLAGMLGLPAAAAYSASKSAVIALMQSLRLDLEGSGIGVTTVCPGYVDTPMITEHERQTVRGIVPVDAAARRIARAIERGRAFDCFPKSTWIQARIASFLPWKLYRLAVGGHAEMEET